MKLRKLIRQIIKEELAKEEFSKPPKMGNIQPTDEPDKDRPGMEGRPEDGMDVSQQHKMMHASKEDSKAKTDYDEETSDGYDKKVRKERTFDNTDELVNYVLDEEVVEEETKETLEEENIEEDASSGRLPPGFEGFGFEDDEVREVKPVPPALRTFIELKRGDKVRIGKLSFDITNNVGDYTKVANLSKSKGRKYWILKVHPDTHEVSVYRGRGGTLDHDPEPRITGLMKKIEEVNAISTGAGGLTSSGKIAGGGANAWKEEEKHGRSGMMWSDHKPNGG